MRTADRFILGRFTAWCHWFQFWTDRTSFWLARVACLPFLTAGALAVANTWFPVLPYQASVFGAFWGLVCMTAAVMIMDVCRRADDGLRAGLTTLPVGLRYLRDSVGMEILRLAAVVMAVSGLARLAYLGLSIGFITVFFIGAAMLPVILYLVAVDPMTSATRRLRNLVPASAPAP